MISSSIGEHNFITPASFDKCLAGPAGSRWRAYSAPSAFQTIASTKRTLVYLFA